MSDDDGFMCNGYGEMIPLTHACTCRHEANGEYSFYHLNCQVEDKCPDCTLYRKVCDACMEPEMEATKHDSADK